MGNGGFRWGMGSLVHACMFQAVPTVGSEFRDSCWAAVATATRVQILILPPNYVVFCTAALAEDGFGSVVVSDRNFGRTSYVKGLLCILLPPKAMQN